MFSVLPSHAQSRTAAKLPKTWASETDRVRAKARAAFRCCPERIKTLFLELMLSPQTASSNDAWGSKCTPSVCRRRESDPSAESSSKTRRVFIRRTLSEDSGLCCDCLPKLISRKRIPPPRCDCFHSAPGQEHLRASSHTAKPMIAIFTKLVILSQSNMMQDVVDIIAGRARRRQITDIPGDADKIRPKLRTNRCLTRPSKSSPR